MNFALYFVLGLCFGSFINALVWRLHQHSRKPKAESRKELSIVNGRSVCPSCHHQLAWYDLVPVVSWLVLRARCRYCHKPISWQYPAVEVLTAVLFGLSYLVLAPVGISQHLLYGLWLAELVVLLALAVYDLRWMLLPNSLVRAALLLAGATLVVDFSLAGTLKAVAAALVASSFFWLLHTFSRGKWMGGGDVKLVFVIGLLLGGSNTIVALLVAFNSAAVVALALMSIKKLGRKSLMPFGPFLIGGAIVAMLWGDVLIDWYQGLMGLG